MVSIVLEAGAQLHQRNADMETALHLACSSGYLSIVEQLYQQGIQINSVNINGYTQTIPAIISSGSVWPEAPEVEAALAILSYVAAC